MLSEYIEAAMERAIYEIIDDPEPYYGEVPELMGVWAIGKTLEECRRELKEVVEEVKRVYSELMPQSIIFFPKP